jgi:hypothetical protein
MIRLNVSTKIHIYIALQERQYRKEEPMPIRERDLEPLYDSAELTRILEGGPEHGDFYFNKDWQPAEPPQATTTS